MTLQEGVAAEKARVKWVIGLLLTSMAVDGMAVLSGFAEQRLLSRLASDVAVAEAEAEASDARQAIVGACQVLAFLATAVAWLCWLHRAYGNLAIMGTKKADFTPGWVVGYWFIPFVNLFRPYQVTRELWLRSERRNGIDSVDGLAAPSVLASWWGVYLISAFLGQALMRFSLRAEELGEILAVARLGIGVDVIGVLSAALAVVVVRGIDTRQQRAVSTSGEALESAIITI